MGILATYQLALNQPPAMLLLRVTMLTALVSRLLASSSPPIEYSINEEIHIGTQIGNLAEDFGRLGPTKGAEQNLESVGVGHGRKG